jgi:hypothetical protein
MARHADSVFLNRLAYLILHGLCLYLLHRVLVQFANRRRVRVCAEAPLRQPVLPPKRVTCGSEESRVLRRQIAFS